MLPIRMLVHNSELVCVTEKKSFYTLEDLADLNCRIVIFDPRQNLNKIIQFNLIMID